MKYKFSHIALSTSSQDKRVLPIATQVFEILNNAGIKVSFDENLSELESHLKIKKRSTKYIIKNAQLLIAIGGDGTMLNCSRRYGSEGVPILGINLGKVGFLTDISPDEITSRLLEVIKGDFIEDINPNSLTTLTGCKLEPLLTDSAVGEAVQFERNGYFATDPISTPNQLVFNQAMALRDSWAKIQAKDKSGG